MATKGAILACFAAVAVGGCGSVSRSSAPAKTAARGRPTYLAAVAGGRAGNQFVVEALTARGRVLRVLGSSVASDLGDLPLEWTRRNSAAVWIAPHGLVVGNINGGVPRRIASCAGGCPDSFDVSPDGTTVVFSRTPGRSGELVSASLATRKQTVLRAVTPKTIYDVSGGWSPDSRSLLYERFTWQYGTIEVARPDGTRPRVLVRFDRPYPHDVRASWSPDGQKVAFVETTGVRLHPTHAGIVDIKSGRVRFLTASPQTPLAFAWAPGSRRLALSAVPPPRACCGGGIAIFSASGKLLHFADTEAHAFEVETLAWTRRGLFGVRGPDERALVRSADGTDLPVPLFHLSRSDFMAVAPREDR